MAISKGRKTYSADVSSRTWRTEIESLYGAVPVVSAYRETIEVVDGEKRTVSQSKVTRSFSDVLKDEVTVGDKTVTGAEMAQLISAFIDLWETQDGEVQSNSTEA